MTALADLIRDFAALLKPAEGNHTKLTDWITAACAVAPPHLRSLTNGLEIDRLAVNAGLTLPYHNGRTEGVNTRTKRIMRQMHGRAGFDLLQALNVTTDYVTEPVSVQTPTTPSTPPRDPQDLRHSESNAPFRVSDLLRPMGWG
ncbi:hypothetical protein ABT255_32480 [Streptomyces mirabilis]